MDFTEKWSAIDFSNLPSSVEEFFSKEENAEMSSYQKMQLSNLRQNYEALRHAGKYVLYSRLSINWVY